MDYSKLMNNMFSLTIDVPQSILDQTSQIKADIEAHAKYNAEKYAALFLTAKTSLAKKELLLQQL